MISRKEANEQGFIVDNSAPGRPLAYKGPRFAMTASEWCYTELEEKMLLALEVADCIMDCCGGDRYERECVEQEREEYNTLSAEIETYVP